MNRQTSLPDHDDGPYHPRLHDGDLDAVTIEWSDGPGTVFYDPAGSTDAWISAEQDHVFEIGVAGGRD